MVLHNLILSIILILYNKKGEPRFRQWLELEHLKEKIIKAVGETSDEFPTHLISFLSTAFRINPKYFEKAGWDKIILAFYAICLKSPTIKLPLLMPSDTESKKDDWEYDGRTWHLYAHMIANSYGWSFEYISQLRVGEALATIQEIITDEQLNKEFIYSLSEIAYPYNKNTKESKFQPLSRPQWMRPRVREIRRYKIPVSSIPIGNVDYSSLPEEIRPQIPIN